MARLPRNHIPAGVRLQVAERQLCQMLGDDALPILVTMGGVRSSLGSRLEVLLGHIAKALDCERSELRLDHHPALENRQTVKDVDGCIIRYIPHEHDPACLRYMEKNDHNIKTNVRGERGQFADNVIAKRERKRQRKEKILRVKKRKVIKQQKTQWHKGKPKTSWPQGRKIQSRGFERR